MSEFSTPLPSGMRVRHIQTTTVNGQVVPVLDVHGKEIELWAVDVPQHIEAADGSALERKAAIEGFVADIRVMGPELALVRAQAVLASEDPAAAELAFVHAKQARDVAAEVALGDTIAAQPGGQR